MLLILIKKQLTEVFRGYFFNRKNKQGYSKKTTILKFIYFGALIFGVLGYIFYNLAASMCGAFCEANLSWFYFDLMGLISITLGVFGDAFSTYEGLYIAKDNDLLLSMPIPFKYIILSRLINVYIIGVIYTLPCIIPSVIAYIIAVGFSSKALLGAISYFIFITFLVLGMSCLFGYVIARISQKLKNNAMIKTFVSLICIGTYYVIYFNFIDKLNDVIDNITNYTSEIEERFLAFYNFGSIATGNIKSICICYIALIVFLVFVWVLLNRSFNLVAISKPGNKKKAYEEKYSVQNSIAVALFKKEFNKFTSSSVYMLNCGLGVILLPVLGLGLIFKGEYLVNTFSSILGINYLPLVLCFGLCFSSTLNILTTPSISLEGKSLWILKSLPVSSWDILKAKLLFHIRLSAPFTGFAALCAVFVLYNMAGITDGLLLVLVVLFPVMFSVFVGITGLILNILYPNFEWTNETVLIKQSSTALISIFGNWAVIILFGAVYYLFANIIPVRYFILIMNVLLIILIVVLTSWIKNKGTKRFEDM